jgi:hypothetical protein
MNIFKRESSCSEFGKRGVGDEFCGAQMIAHFGDLVVVLPMKQIPWKANLHTIPGTQSTIA